MKKMKSDNSLERLTALILLVISLPFQLLIAIIIRCESRGNPIFAQKRMGRGGKFFLIWKWRTMYLPQEGHFEKISDCKSSLELRKKEEFRITKVGRVLRKFGIDETLQLWNIAVGEMSFIGPRPHGLVVILNNPSKYYAPRDNNMLPGLIGLEQTSPLRDHPRAKVISLYRFDKFYCQNHCLLMDIRIIYRTILYLKGRQKIH